MGCVCVRVCARVCVSLLSPPFSSLPPHRAATTARVATAALHLCSEQLMAQSSNLQAVVVLHLQFHQLLTQRSELLHKQRERDTHTHTQTDRIRHKE